MTRAATATERQARYSAAQKAKEQTRKRYYLPPELRDDFLDLIEDYRAGNERAKAAILADWIAPPIGKQERREGDAVRIMVSEVDKDQIEQFCAALWAKHPDALSFLEAPETTQKIHTPDVSLMSPREQEFYDMAEGMQLAAMPASDMREYLADTFTGSDIDHFRIFIEQHFPDLYATLENS